MILGIAITLLFLGLMVSIVRGIRSDIKRDNELYAKLNKEKTAWLAEQALRPKYQVTFEPSNTGELANSEPCEPKVKFWGTGLCKITSAQVAIDLQNAFYKQNFFQDVDGITYPACNVLSSRITQVS